MIFTETKLKGAFTIDNERREDLPRLFRANFLSARIRSSWVEAVPSTMMDLCHDRATGDIARRGRRVRICGGPST